MNSKELLKKFEPKVKQTLEYNRQLWQARFSPCGQYLIGCSYDASIQRWKFAGDKFKPMKPILGHHGWTQCMAFSAAEKRLFTADSWGKLTCWSYEEEDPKPVWNHDAAHDGWIRSLAVSPDEKRIATSGNDREICIWNSQDGKLVDKLPTQSETVFSLCFSPAGNSLVSGNLKGEVHEWNTSTKKVLRTFDASQLYQLNRIQDCGGARHLTIDSSGKYLLCAGQNEPQGGFASGTPAVIVFDWKTGKMTQSMLVGDKQDGFIYDAVFHPAGFVMGTSCAFPKKGKFWFWMPGDKKAFFTSPKINNGRSISLHRDLQHLALMISVSPNANGRKLKEGKYQGGSSKIHILKFPDNKTA